MERVTVKPTLEEVLAYAEEQIKFYLREYAKDAPLEQREEMSQDARMRILRAYSKLEADKGWKTFCQSHCFGAISDYLRRGRGFEEQKWSLRDGDGDMLKHRLDYADQEDDSRLDVDEIVGLETELALPDPAKAPEIQWELLARLCRIDPELHIFVRHVLLGYPLTELTARFGVTRERLGQRLKAFVALLDAPEHFNNPWVKQILFALGLSEQFHMRREDLGIGWTFEPVDLSPFDPEATLQKHAQLVFDFSTHEEASA